MATWLVGGVLALIVAAAIVKIVRDKASGKGSCSCGGDCSRCKGCR